MLDLDSHDERLEFLADENVAESVLMKSSCVSATYEAVGPQFQPTRLEEQKRCNRSLSVKYAIFIVGVPKSRPMQDV